MAAIVLSGRAHALTMLFRAPCRPCPDTVGPELSDGHGAGDSLLNPLHAFAHAHAGCGILCVGAAGRACGVDCRCRTPFGVRVGC